MHKIVEKIIQKISKNLKSKFYFNYDTSKNVWFRAGGNAAVFCLLYDDRELSFILKNIEGIPYEIIGAGSNILVRDSGYDGIIFKYDYALWFYMVDDNLYACPVNYNYFNNGLLI